MNVTINDLRKNIVSNLAKDDIKTIKVEIETIVDFNEFEEIEYEEIK